MVHTLLGAVLIVISIPIVLAANVFIIHSLMGIARDALKHAERLSAAFESKSTSQNEKIRGG